MALNIEKDGTIFITQGDSGDVYIQGISDDKDYRVYFAIQNADRQPVGSELVVNSNCMDTVKFSLGSELTNLLNVPKTEPFAVYHYGIKVCAEDAEDTLFVSGTSYGKVNYLIVYPKFVEGAYVQQ